MTQHTSHIPDTCSLVPVELAEYWFEQVCVPIRVSATDPSASAAENHGISSDV
jgi:hypothetical protein